MQTILLALIAGLLLIIAVNTLPVSTDDKGDLIVLLIIIIPLLLIVALVAGAVFFSFAAVLSTLATMHGFSIP